MTSTDAPVDGIARNRPPDILPSRVRDAVERTVVRRQLTAFFVLAYAFTWLWDAVIYTVVGASPPLIPPVSAPRTWGVPLAAVVVTWLCGGDLRAWARQLLDWRVKPRWFLLALLIPVAADELGAFAAAALGYRLTFLPMPAWQYVAWFLFVLLLAGALEEFGWRGFAQPRLQERYSAATAAIAIGVVWACWHLPLFLVFDEGAYDPGAFLVRYLPWVVALSILLAWSFNATGGSVLPAMIMHAANNAAGLFQVQGELQGLAGTLENVAGPATYWAIAVGLVVAYGTAYVAPRGPVPAIPGFPSTTPESGVGQSEDGAP